MQVFNEKQVQGILKRATELQAEAGGGQTGLTLDELRAVASEVGIDPRFIEQAAVEAQRPAQKKSGFPVFGAPVHLREERMLAAAVDEDEWIAMVEEMRRAYGQVGTVTGAGNTRSWSCGDHKSHTKAVLSLTQRRGNAQVVVQRNLEQEIGLTFGLGSSPVLVLAILIAVGELFPMAAGLNLLVAALVFLAGFFALRAIPGHIGGKEQQKLTSVLARLEAIAGESEALPAPPVSTPPAPTPLLDLGVEPDVAAQTAAPRTRTR